MTWDVFRILIGRGLVDYLGTVGAETKDGAEDFARQLFGCSEGEKIELVEEASTEDAESRLRAWIRDFGNAKQKQFIDDLNAVLNAASKQRS